MSSTDRSASPPVRTATTRPLGGGRGAVHVEDVFPTSPADLWSAVTDPVRLCRWLLTEIEGDPRVGGAVRVCFTSGWEGPGRIEVCDEPHRILVTLEPGSEEETTIEATLTAEGGGTRLVVEERGVPLSQVPAFGAGWQVHVEDLGTYLAGRVPGDWATRWAELRPAYDDHAGAPG